MDKGINNIHQDAMTKPIGNIDGAHEEYISMCLAKQASTSSLLGGKMTPQVARNMALECIELSKILPDGSFEK